MKMETENQFEQEELAADITLDMVDSDDPEKQKAMMKLLDLVIAFRVEQPGMIGNLRIVGCWLWFETKEKPSNVEIVFLKALGFRWNRARSLWQHNCGFSRRQSNGDPKKVYGSYHPDVLRSAGNDE